MREKRNLRLLENVLILLSNYVLTYIRSAMMNIDLLYIAEGKLHLKLIGAPFRIISSEFGEATQERMQQIQRRNIFRDRGIMASQIPPQILKHMEERANTPTPVNISSVCCDERGKIYYALNVGYVAGIFTLDEERINEKRLFHGSDFSIQHLHLNEKEQLIACSIIKKDGTANIAIMPVNGARPNEITEGDSLDLAPRWLPNRNKVLVYQSAGIARNSQGSFIDRSPFRIEQLDFSTQDIICLVEDEKYDFLEPQMTQDGTLFYIRRPYSFKREQITVWSIIKDILLLPLRLANTIYQIVNFFALTFTGKPLIKIGEVQPSATQQMEVWGDLIDLQKLPKRKNYQEGDASGLVPDSWQLICKTSDGTEKVISEGVSYYDLTNDGSIIYTNGNAIYGLKNLNEKPKKILNHKLVKSIAIAFNSIA
jgi:hypothetical protein